MAPTKTQQNDSHIDQSSPPDYRQPYADESKMEDHYEASGYYGIMYAGDYEYDTVRCVQEAYGDSSGTPRSTHINGDTRRSLKFHTEWLTIDAACAAINAVPDYNGFHAPAVIDAVEQFPQNVKITIAREGSPALYIWTDQPVTVMNLLASINDDLEYGGCTFAPGGPDELGFMPDPDTFPGTGIGEPVSSVSNGTLGVVRGWWD